MTPTYHPGTRQEPRRIANEVRVFGVLLREQAYIVADDHGTGAKMRDKKLQGRHHDGNPCVHQHEIDGAADFPQGFQRVALSQIDYLGKPCFGEVCPRGRSFRRLALRGDDDPFSVVTACIVTHSRG